MSSRKGKTVKRGISLLLDKPSEPIIFPKGQNEIFFQLPKDYLEKIYKKKLQKIKKFSKADIRNIVIEKITIPENELAKAAEVKTAFSLFLPHHLEAAEVLINVFMDVIEPDKLLSVAAFARERVNPVLFNYALSVAILHRSDTKDIPLPNFINCFPGKFLEATAFSAVRREANLLPTGAREPIVLTKNFTATNREPEQAVAYFREDLGINLHHWHWHVIYPTRGRASVVGKDRRGELFYYMHQQVLARYNTERMCNKMDVTKPLSNLRANIIEGYFPKLNQLNSNRAWPPRFRNCYLEDIDRPGDRIAFTINTIEDWIVIVKQAIANGEVERPNGEVIKLDAITGIDMLGNIIEASDLSINRTKYGNIHNMGHVLIAWCHDPDERFLEGMGIMGDVATAMRDPIFYRWHTTINDLFVLHKKMLPPYTKQELNFENVKIESLSVQTPDKTTNDLYTFWEQSDIDISRGLDFVPSGPTPISITYLQHQQFTYTIVVNNTSGKNIMGTARIFLAPLYNLESVELFFENKRQFMIELDKFTISLTPGLNTIQRKSSDSSVTIEYETTYRNIDTATVRPEDLNLFRFCGCGWPDNMLIPKGTTEGYKMDLFAMISDYELDKIDQEGAKDCASAESYCGLFNSKYPDKRSMGYPFDRTAEAGVQHLPEFLTDNMKVTPVTIIHENKTIVRDPLAVGSTKFVVSGV